MSEKRIEIIKVKGDNPFPKILEERRKHFGYTRKTLAIAIMKSENQIFRYERGIQFPSFEVLRSLCLILETTADEFLGIMKVNALDDPLPNVVYVWELRPTRGLYWSCPNCKGINIAYEIQREIDMVELDLMCEHCESEYNEWHEDK